MPVAPFALTPTKATLQTSPFCFDNHPFVSGQQLVVEATFATNLGY